MINLTTTIQEITIQAYSFGVYDYLFNREHNDMSRDQILNLFEEWGKEFEEIEKAHEEDNDWYYYDEIDEFVNKKYTQLKMEHALQYGIAIGDYITYEGGTYKISGFTDRGILVDEVKRAVTQHLTSSPAAKRRYEPHTRIVRHHLHVIHSTLSLADSHLGTQRYRLLFTGYCFTISVATTSINICPLYSRA